MDLTFASTTSAPVAGLPADAPGSVPAAPVDALRRVLKAETERLRTRHRLGLGGREIACGRSDLVDVVVGRACRIAADEIVPRLTAGQQQVAVVALGGYGRRELAPCSDVDLLFLHADRGDDDVRAVVERALALLWDSGLTVGHSFRTVGECVSMARNDLHSRTAVAEARLLAGSEALFSRLVEQVDSLVFASARATVRFLDALRADLDARYEKFGRAVGLLEPHVKESAGGLRDLHAVLWVGHAVFGVKGLAALHEQCRISERERRSALRAYDHLCRVRNEAHFTTGRKTDLLTLDLQPALAANLGYRSRRGAMASEALMRDYYRHASELSRFARAFLLRHAAGPPRRRFHLGLLRRRPRGVFEIRDGKLCTPGPEALANPRRLLEAFAIVQREGVELSEELKLDVRDSLHVVDRGFRGSPEPARALMRLLGQPGRVSPALRAMHETGLLGRVMPEFGRMTFLVQHDYYHRYTVDEHTLVAVDALDRIPGTEDASLARFARVLGEVEQPASLYLGLLLHDVGKGRAGGHVRRGARIAHRVCARLGLEPRQQSDVVFLVESHLEMSQVSQRRDLSEPALVEAFAGRVGTVDRLNMLLLLTYADHCGVGPGIWSEWKGALLWDLYDRSRAWLTSDADPASVVASPGARDVAAARLREEFAASEVERHLALMPARYLRAVGAEAMERHFRLMRALGDGTLAAEWRRAEHCTELAVTGRDHRGLFAELAGTLTAAGLDILSVDLYTREDGVVVDLFKLRGAVDHGPVPAARHGAITDALRSAVDGRHDVAAAVEKWRRGWRRRTRRPLVRPVVRFDSLSSAESSVIEVRAEDEPGLAYRIASVLAAQGLDIGFAKIATDKSHALDVFYVTDGDGSKLDAEAMSRVEAALGAALDPRNGPHS